MTDLGLIYYLPEKNTFPKANHLIIVEMKNYINPKISVIIPCFNVANYLQSCLKSIVVQPIGEVEYIFVNDGSTDETLALLTEFCVERPFYQLINQQNAGVSAARNAALDIAKGEYIYLLDGDDRLTENAISAMLQCIQDTSVDIVLSEVALLRGNASQREKLLMCAGEYSPDELYRSCSIFPTRPQLLYKRSIIETSRIRFNSDIRLGEVYEFTIRVLAKSHKVKVTSDCFFYYVMRSSSATHRPNYSTDLTVIDTLKQYELYGNGLKNIPSFQVTAFKMLMSFTYNKYAKLGLNDEMTINTVKRLLSTPIVKEYINKVAFGKRIPKQERLLALYVLFTRVLGYKMISKFFK